MITEYAPNPLPVRMEVTGDLTIYTAQTWREKLLDLPAEPPLLELDLSGVEDIDSAGLQLLVAARKQIAASGRQLHLVKHSPSVRELLEFCRLEAYFGDPAIIPA